MMYFGMSIKESIDYSLDIIMGNSLFRNRFWFYKTFYDDYLTREIKYSLGVVGVVTLPFYWWGVHIN